MTVSRLRLALSAAIAAAALGSCDGATAPDGGLILGFRQLLPATWYMHAANDSLLPTTISVRSVGIVEERTIVDSSRLVVRNDFTYQQRYWLRVFVSGVLDRSDLVIDEGTWTSDFAVYRFSSTLRPRTFTVTVPVPGRLLSDEPLVFFTSAPTTQGRYHLDPPIPP